jgi:hypothetical protein
MLGADGVEDLPDIDKKRVKIVVNQAYRDCYSPIDGKRPRWASRSHSVVFQEDQQEATLPEIIVDIEKYPELVGYGPMSPMNSSTDELRARSHHGGDFRVIGGYRGRFPSISMDKPEKDRPIWYYIDQSDQGDDLLVYPRLVLYPVPDKEYTVKLTGNIIPETLTEDNQIFRLPGDVSWDIMFPIAQGRMLNDPRYNGDNKEIIGRSAHEAKKRLASFRSPQKHKTLRLHPRKGW